MKFQISRWIILIIIYLICPFKVYYNKNTIYICADTLCIGKLKIKFNLNDISIEDYKIKNYEITKDYNLDYKEHNYYKDNHLKDNLKFKPIIYKKNIKYKLFN